MADMTTIKERIAETIYPNGQGAITAESHQALLLEMVDDINLKKQDNIEDIDAIRAGAKLGETALQELPDLSHLATKEEVKTGLATKANTTGRYPDLSVGFADDLVGRGESVPAEFSFRASGGKSIKDGTARIKRIKGNSVVWNQQSSGESLGGDNGTTKALPQGARIVQGHKYLIMCDKVVNSELCLYYNDGEGKTLTYLKAESYKFIESSISFTANGQANTEGGMWWYLTNASTNDARPRLIDLTQMFGAGNEPTTFEEYEARKPIVEDEYAYNEGEVIHMTAEGIKSIGDNAWDEEWEEGYYDVNNGQKMPATSLFRSVNHFRILPNYEYYLKGTGIRILYYDANMNYISYAIKSNGIVTTPPNSCYASIFGENQYYSTDIMITLVHSGWKQDTDAGYQPYWEDRLIFDQRIKDEFPNGMKSAGAAHDVAYNDMNKGVGVTETRISSVDMGDLDWVQGNSGVFRVELLKLIKDLQYGNNIMTIYTTYKGEKTEALLPDKSIMLYNGSAYPLLGVKDFSYTDAATFKAAMAGVMLYYELAEPTIIEYDEPFNLDYRVADFGTEQAITEQPSAPISADIIYQFNAVDMIREHEIEITELQSIIATMQAQLASLTNKE